MKLLSTLFILVALTACGKKAEFDGRNAGPNVPTGVGVSADTDCSSNALDCITLSASISYEENTEANVISETGNLSGVSNFQHYDNVKIPQALYVNAGWAGRDNSATLTMRSSTLGVIICTYKSQATQDHKPYTDEDALRANGISEEVIQEKLNKDEKEETKGLYLTFSNCTRSVVTTETISSGISNISLTIISADETIPQTRVRAKISIMP